MAQSKIRKTLSLTVSKFQNEFIPKEPDIMRVVAPLLKHEAENGRSVPDISSFLWWRYPMTQRNLIMNDDLTGSIYTFNRDMVSIDIWEECKAQNLRYIGNYLEALSIIVTAIISGAIDDHDTRIIAYFRDTPNDIDSYYLSTSRSSKNRVRIGIIQNKKIHGFKAGYGICTYN